VFAGGIGWFAVFGAGGFLGEVFGLFAEAFVLAEALEADFSAVALAVLAGFFAAAGRVFAADFLTPVFAAARAVLPAPFLEDFSFVFLRVFLGIRLPFVAFGGSIIRVLRLYRLARIGPAAGLI